MGLTDQVAEPREIDPLAESLRTSLEAALVDFRERSGKTTAELEISIETVLYETRCIYTVVLELKGSQ